MAYRFKSAKTSTGLTVIVVQNFYTGLWEIRYADGGKWAGPYKTKKEAIKRMMELTEDNS